MSNVIIPQRFWLRRGTAAALAAANEVLYAGEVCVETDTGRAKIGDGATAWIDLLYAVPGRIDLQGLADRDVLVWDNSDQKWVASDPPGGGIESIVAGEGVEVDNTDPNNPVVSTTGGGGSGAITFNIGNSTNVILPGNKGRLYIPFNCTIDDIHLVANTVGSMVIDIWKSTFAAYPPDSGDSICGTSKPSIATDDTYADATLAGWDASLAAGDVLLFHVDSCSSITYVSGTMKVTKT